MKLLKNKKIILVLFLVVLSIGLFRYLDVKADDEVEDEIDNEAQRGDLRCPLEISSSNVRCEEIKNSSGVVTEVRIIYGSVSKPGDVQIIKYVKKTETLGRFTIQFEVKGDIKQREVPLPTYVSVLLDMSSTIKSKEGQVISAAKKFAQKLVPNNEGASNYYISLWQFGTNALHRRGLDNKNFDSPKNLFVSYDDYFSAKGRHKSFVDKAFKGAYNELKDVSGNKYVLLLGDGYYWYTRDTGVKDAHSYSDKLRNIGVEFLILRYKSSEDSEDNLWRSEANNAKCYKEKKSKCNWRNMMRFLCGSFSGCGDLEKTNFWNTPSNYEEIFEQIAEKIIKDTGGSRVMSELKDHIGESFFLYEDDGQYKNFEIGEITKEGVKTKPFDIEIDDLASTGWHKANEDFKLTYTDEDNNEKVINVYDNAEVYWTQPDLNIKSCVGSSEASTRASESDEYSYYVKNCQEGYVANNKKSLSGFKVDVSLSRYDKPNLKYVDLQSGVKEFETYGIGFSVKLKISTNVKCNISFDYQQFEQDYEAYKSDYARTNELKNDSEYLKCTEEEEADFDASDGYASCSAEKKELLEKDAIIYAKRIDAMDKMLASYTGNLTTELEEYQERFKNQIATLKVTYEDGTSTNGEFENEGEVTGSPECKDITKKTVNGKEIIVKQSCYLNLNKTMSLPSVCLSMKTGDTEECYDETTQLDGGRYFYTKNDQKKGKIYINVLDAGYKSSLDFKIGGENCRFTQDNTPDVQYRQIKLSDPFIQELNKERGIGRNYYNERYNFINVITSDLWDADKAGNLKYPYEYYYTMGKINVDNIRKNSQEVGVSSYLGRSCYFSEKYSSKEKYVCEFTRNASNYGYDNGFFKTASFDEK